jgi:hypothetical protein
MAEVVWLYFLVFAALLAVKEVWCDVYSGVVLAYGVGEVSLLQRQF